MGFAPAAPGLPPAAAWTSGPRAKNMYYQSERGSTTTRTRATREDTRPDEERVRTCHFAHSFNPRCHAVSLGVWQAPPVNKSVFFSQDHKKKHVNQIPPSPLLLFAELLRERAICFSSEWEIKEGRNLGQGVTTRAPCLPRPCHVRPEPPIHGAGAA